MQLNKNHLSETHDSFFNYYISIDIPYLGQGQSLFHLKIFIYRDL